MRFGPQKAATTRSYWFAIRRTFTASSAADTVFECRIIETSPGRIVLKIAGDNAAKWFANEAGGHRWQRVPPTERNGRRQSSTITVAILGSQKPIATLDERDVDYRYCVASVGAGGQNRQKNETACVAIHRLSGLEAKCEDERSRERNRQKALTVLRQRFAASQSERANAATNSARRDQIGCGERGDKIRTVQVHNGVVTNHLNGRKVSVDRYFKGEIDAVQ